MPINETENGEVYIHIGWMLTGTSHKPPDAVDAVLDTILDLLPQIKTEQDKVIDEKFITEDFHI